MIRFSKVWFKNWSQIDIRGIKCNFYNITQIVKLFSLDYLVLTVDAVEADCSFLMLIKEYGLDYTCCQKGIDDMKISVRVPYNLICFILKAVINENPENILMFHWSNQSNWKDQLHYSSEVLIRRGISDLFIAVAPDENALSVSVNKEEYLFREVYKKLKSLKY